MGAQLAHSQKRGKAPGKIRPDCTSLAMDVAQAFQNETGRTTSARLLTPAVDEKLPLARFLAPGGSSAAVLLMGLADEGAKFFVALTMSVQGTGVSAALTQVRAEFVARRVERFCKRNGIGYLGFVNRAPQLALPTLTPPIHEQVAAAIAHRLASATFFCCDAFRTGSGNVHNLSQMREAE
ncbi:MULTISPECIES: hypothetical protein [Paraburkholderia]|uniref:Uncharacterized protein n=1 Tax=Paraburkholderia podalyriae TaxID=1938811 RepID=A0ABR7PYV7_9BURK|nr:hypothetical protein [Paraburkholderia podalyriae]MBC8751401.1 hypothetical protein [Paraburkholderia podalyriae]